MKDNHIIQLQLLNLSFLLMRQVSDEFECAALRSSERVLIRNRLYQLQNNPTVQQCKCSQKMLSHLQQHWHSVCEQQQPAAEAPLRQLH